MSPSAPLQQPISPPLPPPPAPAAPCAGSSSGASASGPGHGHDTDGPSAVLGAGRAATQAMAAVLAASGRSGAVVDAADDSSARPD
ncbi:hypothetical protein [Geodermatophilus sp. DSM 45219]|uniref:hypothetical protein n=1 Tax=Geodermatophilus sp. DSM 45219 TaxID=1881103 RepID=UPI000B841B90|nr:hypothetical protein [Geodermatophilus sp. DSM 45219]